MLCSFSRAQCPPAEEPSVTPYPSLLRFLGRKQRGEKKWTHLCIQVWESAMTEQHVGRGSRMAGPGKLGKLGQGKDHSDQAEWQKADLKVGSAWLCYKQLYHWVHFTPSFTWYAGSVSGWGCNGEDALKLLTLHQSKEEGSRLTSSFRLNAMRKAHLEKTKGRPQCSNVSKLAISLYGRELSLHSQKVWVLN